MRMIFLLVLFGPALVFANGGRQPAQTSLENYEIALRDYNVRKSAERIFKNNYDRGNELFNAFLVDQPGDDPLELKLKHDARRMIVEISQWQMKSGKNSSKSYVEAVYSVRDSVNTLEWSFRRRDLLLELDRRMRAASERAQQQKKQPAAGLEYGGSPTTWRIPLSE